MLLKRISNIFRLDSPFWRHSAVVVAGGGVVVVGGVGGVLVSLEVLLMVVVVLENLECCNFFSKNGILQLIQEEKTPIEASCVDTINDDLSCAVVVVVVAVATVVVVKLCNSKLIKAETNHIFFTPTKTF